MNRALHIFTFLAFGTIAIAAVGNSGCRTQDHASVQQSSGSQCVVCHQSDYDNTLDPVHEGRFPTTCEVCHSTDFWQPAEYTHPWPLNGAHVNASCESCHVGDPPIYDGTPQVCVGCHQSDYDGATQPLHAGNYATTCQDCHSEAAWRPAMIEHEWPLVGAHARTPCATCHLGDPPVYTGTPRECIGCHQDDYDGTMNPVHPGNYATTCQDCHGTEAWRPAMFDHSWPLTGAHATTLCSSCHMGDPPRYMGTSRECVGCHQSDYDTSPFPGHDTFPLGCQDCHSTTGWTPAMGGAHPNDQFPLNEKHNGIACLECHNVDLGSPVMGMNTDCVGCHEDEHTREEMDRKHREVMDYPRGAAPPNFCIDCHPDGGK